MGEIGNGYYFFIPLLKVVELYKWMMIYFCNLYFCDRIPWWKGEHPGCHRCGCSRSRSVPFPYIMFPLPCLMAQWVSTWYFAWRNVGKVTGKCSMIVVQTGW